MLNIFSKCSIKAVQLNAVFISAGVDIGVGKFEVLPRFTRQLMAGTNGNPVNFDITFEFSLTKGPESTASLPTQFKYKLIMSKDKDPANALNIDVASSEATHSDMGAMTVQGMWGF